MNENIGLIHHFLEESAGVWGDKCALVHGDVRVTYDCLNRAANRLARWLIGQEVVPGDRVGILLENSLEYVVSYYGSLKAGCVAVPLNPELRPDGLENLLADITPPVVIAATKNERALHALDLARHSVRSVLVVNPKLSWHAAPIAVHPFEEALSSGDDGAPDVPLDETSLASIIYTSGSTGKPKGVMLSHRNIAANTRSIVSYLNLTRADIQMVVLPFFYVMGKSLLNTHVAVGGTVVLNNTFAYPASVLQQMVNEGVTGFSGVPSTYAYLLYRSPLKTYRDKLCSLRYCSQAGGHMARHVKEELLSVLPEHTELYVMYGATEAAARLTYVEPGRLREKIDSIGIPIPGVTMRVLDETGAELPHGETGELVAGGQNIMRGYWNDRESTERALGRHGYRTGDLGYRDEDGYFHIVGRRDNQLKVGGHRVNPQEIEDALMATGLLIEVAVMGIEDELSGHRLVAVAVPCEATITGTDILAACFARLPRYKLPADIKLVKALPKNSNGKIDRGGCKELLIAI